MELTVLGSGTAETFRRGQSAYTLRIGREILLLDCGAGTIVQMQRAKINPSKITNLLLTHYSHSDHSIEIPAIIVARNSAKPEKPLNVFAPSGFKKFYKTTCDLFMKSEKPAIKTNISIAGNSKTRKKSFALETRLMNHKIFGNKTAVGYRITHKRKCVVYSGDTDYCTNIIKLARNADLLVLECNSPNSKKRKGHLTPKECGAIATKANAKTLLLTHFSTDWGQKLSYVKVRKQTRPYFKGKIIVAKDLMKVKI